MPEQAYDLKTEEGVQGYLKGTPFASSSVQRLSGGNANFVYRLYLIEPHDGKPIAVIKVDYDFVAGQLDVLEKDRIPFPVERQDFEVEALRGAQEAVSDDSMVVAPKVFLFDRENHVVIMEDAGEDSLTLKELLKSRPLSVKVAEDIGGELGKFLASFHQWGQNNVEKFSSNQSGKSLSSYVVYGRLLSTLEGKDGLSALDHPSVKLSDAECSIVSALASEKHEAIMAADNMLVHGDWWTGNQIVSLDSKGELRKVFVVDWEVCKPGLPGLDIGQLLAELETLRMFHSERQDAVAAAMQSFLEMYSKSFGMETSVIRDAIVHKGAHLCVWTPRVPWGDDETTRKVVKKGVDLLLKGQTSSDEWIKEFGVETLLN